MLKTLETLIGPEWDQYKKVCQWLAKNPNGNKDEESLLIKDLLDTPVCQFNGNFKPLILQAFEMDHSQQASLYHTAARYIFRHAILHELPSNPQIEVSPGETMHWMDWVADSKDHMKLMHSSTCLKAMSDLMLVELHERNFLRIGEDFGFVLNQMLSRKIPVNHFHDWIENSHENLLNRASVFNTFTVLHEKSACHQVRQQGLDVDAMHDIASPYGISHEVLQSAFEMEADAKVQMNWMAALCLYKAFNLATLMLPQVKDYSGTCLRIEDDAYSLSEFVGHLEKSPLMDTAETGVFSDLVKSACASQQAAGVLDEIQASMGCESPAMARP